MKQLAQAVNGGRPRLLDVPPPALLRGGVLVRTEWSLVSAGTDRMVVELAGKSLVGKARSRPDQVKKVLKKIRTEGLGATLDAVRARLSEDIPLGYSSAGRVVAVGVGVTDLRPGQTVACAGAGSASHAEQVFVPRNLVVKVPDGLDLRLASTVTLGAIALQGFRRADPALGEKIAVVGLGLIGLITVQILRAAGCRVLAVDLDPKKAALAREMGAHLALDRNAGDLVDKARQFGAGHGLDAAIVTAASESSDPTVLAAEMCRLGGRVVVVGAVGLTLPRRIFYEKELDLRLARSYGPGRHDPEYEEKGIDYPYPYVRFTAGRNMEDYLTLLGSGEVDVEPLLSREFSILEGEDAYDLLMSEEGRSVVGMLFSYPGPGKEPDARRRPRRRPAGKAKEGVGIGMVGAGAFARGVLLPALKGRPDFRATGVITTRGLSAVNARRQGGFSWATTDRAALLSDGETDAVIVATRHHDHAAISIEALRAGKDVFVEKPLALTRDELDEVARAVRESGRFLMVGFNRRFAPTVRALKERLEGRAGPLHMVYRIDAGVLPADHWTRDPEVGGGRILGEVCHFVDLLIFLAGCRPESVVAEGLPDDGVTATLRFPDGSVGTVVYACSGDAGMGKERLETFVDAGTFVIDNFKKLGRACGGKAGRVPAGAGKGHREEMRAFLDAVRSGGPSPVPFGQAYWSTATTLAVMESLANGERVTLGGE